MTMRIAFLLFALATGLVGVTPALAQTAAGEVTMVTGRGTALMVDGNIRPLTRGDSVFPGEVVTSGPNSYVNLRFRDGGLVLLRPNSRFQVEEFAYTPPPAETPPPERVAAAPAAATESRAFFRLLRGGFRAVTGAVGQVDRNEYRVATPVATIGIRGTDYVVVMCDAACNQDPVISTNLPAGASAEGGVVVGVISGGVFVLTDLGGYAEIGPDQYLVTLPDGTIITLPFQPRFLRVDPVPNPADCI
jgi:hypothetical protein